MHAAAVALTLGVADPLAFLALSRTDAVIAGAVLAEAGRLRVQHDQALADYTSVRTAGHTVTGVAQIVRQALRSLRPR